MTDRMPVLWAVFRLSEFAGFPLAIYHKGLQFFLTWINPYGFTAFLPAAWFLDREGYAFVADEAPITAAAAMAVACSVWLFGLKNDSSTGSRNTVQAPGELPMRIQKPRIYYSNF